MANGHSVATAVRTSTLAPSTQANPRNVWPGCINFKDIARSWETQGVPAAAMLGCILLCCCGLWLLLRARVDAESCTLTRT